MPIYRGIPLPVNDVRVTIQVKPPVRLGRSVSYVKTKKRWLVELRFNSDIDLAICEQFLRDTTIRLVECREPEDREGRFFLIESRIPNTATMDEVWKWVDEELPRISAAMAIQFPDFTPPTCRCIVDLNAPGGHIHTIPPGIQANVPGKDNMPLVRRLLREGSSEFLYPLLAKCDTDHDFSEAMTYCGQGLGHESAPAWANLYRAYEVVADRFGGDNGISTKMGLCSANQLERFKRTVNHQEAIGGFSRHARLRYQPPPNPMSFREAVHFVLALLLAWKNSGE